MSDLSRAAYRSVARFVEKAAGSGARPAMVVVKHTFGEGVRFHPHLHALATAGGWDKDQTWRPLPAWDPHAIRSLFEIEVFRFLRRKDLLSRERIRLIRSWPHSGFNVHVSRAIAAGDKSSLARVARYMLRAPLMLSRIACDRERATVRVDPYGSRACQATELDVLDFIAPPAVQVAGPHERLVQYHGDLYTLNDAMVLVEMWRKDYNTTRPHSSLGYRPPAPEGGACVLAAMLAGSIIVLLLAYRFYGAFLSRRFGVDESRETPSHTDYDGVDRVPAKREVLLGHHFSSIAGAGPIVGPIIAAAATAVAVTATSAMLPKVFRADHPFIFIIRDNLTGSILFMGRLVDPGSQD